MSEDALITIFLSIPEDVVFRFEELKKKLSVLYKTKGILPESHITLYQCKISKDDIDTVLEKVKDIAGNITQLNMQPTGLNIKNEYIGIAYKKTQDTDKLHVDIVEALNKFRGDRVRSTYVEKRETYSLEEKINIDQYGYPYVFSEFKPHVALIALEDKNEVSIFDPTSISLDIFSIKDIGVAVLVDGKKEIIYIKGNTKTNITNPTEEDFSRIVEIHNEAEKPFQEIYSEEEKKCFGDGVETIEGIKDSIKDREILIFKKENSVLGYVVFRKKNNGVVWISSLYVDPLFQKQGIGGGLLCAVEDFARESNCKVIALETHKDAFWALGFYKKHEYEIINNKIETYPYNRILEKPPAPNRPLLAKILF